MPLNRTTKEPTEKNQSKPTITKNQSRHRDGRQELKLPDRLVSICIIIPIIWSLLLFTGIMMHLEYREPYSAAFVALLLLFWFVVLAEAVTEGYGFLKRRLEMYIPISIRITWKDVLVMVVDIARDKLKEVKEAIWFNSKKDNE